MIGAELERAPRRFLDQHGGEFPSIRTVIFDPYDECRPDRAVDGGIDFRVRPLMYQKRDSFYYQPPTGENGVRPNAVALGTKDFFNHRVFRPAAQSGDGFATGAAGADDFDDPKFPSALL